MTDRAPLSILVPVKNERENLRACLASCTFADEVVVVDSGSQDGSPEIATASGARVVQFQWNGCLPKKKNWALANVAWRNEWIFILDADERIPPGLAEEITRIVNAPDFDGYFVNRRFWFLDGWLRHSGYYPSWNLRLFRHRLGRFEHLPATADSHSGDNEVHEHVILTGRAGRMRNEMDHYAFPSIAVWVEKHNRYSNWEARLLVSGGRNAQENIGQLDPVHARKRRLKHLAAHLPFRPTLRFLYHYVLRGGILDGYRGFVFCRLMGFYEFLSVAKASELRRTH